MKKFSPFSQKGFSLNELLIAGGLLVGLAVGFSSMISNQQKAIKGILIKVEAQNIQNTIADLMRNENNCIATMIAASATAPDMTSPVDIPMIMTTRLVNGVVQSTPFYQAGRTYDGIKIASMVMRPYDPTVDTTPSAKLVVNYEITAKIVGPSSFSKKLDMFFNTQASPQFPAYAFRCNVGGGTIAEISPEQFARQLRDALSRITPTTVTGCFSDNSSHSVVATCPTGSVLVSCSGGPGDLDNDDEGELMVPNFSLGTCTQNVLRARCHSNLPLTYQVATANCYSP